MFTNQSSPLCHHLSIRELAAHFNLTVTIPNVQAAPSLAKKHKILVHLTPPPRTPPPPPCSRRRSLSLRGDCPFSSYPGGTYFCSHRPMTKRKPDHNLHPCSGNKRLDECWVCGEASSGLDQKLTSSGLWQTHIHLFWCVCFIQKWIKSFFKINVHVFWE